MQRLNHFITLFFVVNINIENFLKVINKWWLGVVSNHRTLREQIYSLPRLASSLPNHIIIFFTLNPFGQCFFIIALTIFDVNKKMLKF